MSQCRYELMCDLSSIDGSEYCFIHRLYSIVKYIQHSYWLCVTLYIAAKYIVTDMDIFYSLNRPISHPYPSLWMQTLRKWLDKGLHGIQCHVASYSRQLAVFLDA